MYGTAKQARFKGKNQLDSLESKSNSAGIRWRHDAVEWSGIKLNAIVEDYDPVLRHGLKARVKYVRLVRRKYNGNRFYAQLVCEEWVAAAVQTKVPESQNVVDVSRESVPGYPARQCRAVGTPRL